MCAPHFSEREFRDSDRAPDGEAELPNILQLSFLIILSKLSIILPWNLFYRNDTSFQEVHVSWTSQADCWHSSSLVLWHFFSMCNGLNINWLPHAHAFEVVVSCWQHWFGNYLDKKHSWLILRFREQGYTLLACGCGLGSLCPVCQSEVTSHLKSCSQSCQQPRHSLITMSLPPCWSVTSQT